MELDPQDMEAKVQMEAIQHSVDLLLPLVAEEVELATVHLEETEMEMMEDQGVEHHFIVELLAQELQDKVMPR